jgi:hypothetical protein
MYILAFQHCHSYKSKTCFTELFMCMTGPIHPNKIPYVYIHFYIYNGSYTQSVKYPFLEVVTLLFYIEQQNNL